MKTGKKILLLIFILLSLAITDIYPHGNEKHGRKDTLRVMASDTSAVQPYRIEVFESLFDHIHNKIIHFPIAFVVAGIIFTAVGVRYDKLNSAVPLLVFFAGLFSLLAYLTGNLQASTFENTSKEWIVRFHETLGIITTIFIWLWFLFINVKVLKKFAWIPGIISLLMVLVTGFYGGILAHG
jgi:uncharacterized membrane protein